MSTGGAAAATPSRIHLDRGATWRLSEQLYLADKVDPVGAEVSAPNLYRQFGALLPDWYEDQLKAVNGALTGERDLPGLAVRSVLDPEYGAIADGTTDCTAAFQAALDQVGSEGGGTVIVPPVLNVSTQSYRLNGTVTIPAGVVLAGCGARSIVRCRASADQFRFPVGLCRSGLRDLVLLGNSSSPTGTCVRLTQSQFVELQRLEIWDFEIAIDVSDGSSFSAYNRIDHCEINRSTVCGIRIHQSSNGVTIIGGRIFWSFDGANGGIAIDVQDARAVSITGVAIEAYDIGLRLAGAASGSMTGSWMEKGANGPPGTDRVDFVIDGFEESEFFEGGWSFLGNHSTDPWPLQSVELDVRAFGAIGDGVTNDTAAVQAAIDALATGQALHFPAGTYVCGNLTFSNKVNCSLIGEHATIQWTGNAGGGFNRIGLQVVGTVTRCTFRGLRLVGNGVEADGHAGVYMNSGQTIADLLISECEVRDVTLGISLNADSAGSIRDCTVERCIVHNVVGINSGFGYGLHIADGGTAPTRTRFLNNRITQAQRHSIYIARGFGCSAIGNNIDLHRDGTTDGAVRGAIVVARGGDHLIANNRITRSNNACLFLDAGDNPGETLTNVVVVGNVFELPTSSAFLIPMLYVGEDITPTDRIDGITIQGNTFRADAWNQSAIRMNWGHGVLVQGNSIQLTGVTSAVYAIALQARGEASLSATSSSRWSFVRNDIRITAGGGGSGAAFRLNPPFVDDSIVDAHFAGNTASVPTAMFSVSTNVVNTALTVEAQATTGLTFAGSNRLASNGPAYVVDLDVSSTTTMRGAIEARANITLTQIGTAVLLGDGSTAGNVWLEPRKADANALTFMQWRVGTAAGGLRWLWQFASDEDLNLQRYDAAGAFVDTPFALDWATGLATFTLLAATRISGSLTVNDIGSSVFLGDGSTSGNVDVCARKADANNLGYFTLRIGTASSGNRWSWQFDSSEHDNLLHYDGSGNLLTIRPFSFRYVATNGRAEVSIGRLSLDRQTTLVNGDFALSAALGNTATAVVAANSTEHRGQVTITPQGSGLAGGGTITLTFPNGTRLAAGWTIVVRNGGTDTLLTVPGVGFTVADTATTIVITLNAGVTPVSGNTLIFRWQMLG